MIAMAMTRLQRRHQANIDRYKAGQKKPPTRKQAQAWLAPIRNAFLEMQSGEMDSYRGYAITRINARDIDFARVDHCINGFVAMLNRVFPDFDTALMKKVSNKLESGVLITLDEVNGCLRALDACEDLLITVSRGELKAAALTEQVNIELEQLGLKEAA